MSRMTRAVDRFVLLVQRLAGFGVDTPPEAQVWAELSPDRALHRITHQAEADFIYRGPATS
ncbi:hypothetical protein ACQP00_32665 [Dactylosporangium sp. CS-047395]|uniref:hypothetical protein n=1 Tax=Dactylosporangium sp. CS-047395 TaxID=3239936 RepID=UPI003D925D53